LSEGDLARARLFSFDDDVIERRRFWIGIARRLASPVDAMDAAAEIVNEARDAAKALEQHQKAEVVELSEALGEGRGTAGARNALAKRHKRELRRAEEQVLAEGLGSLASLYRDILATRAGGEEGITNLDLVTEIRTWAASDVGDAELLRAVERCVEARASLLKNANVPLAIESTLVALARLVPVQSRVGARG
jgi:hypothetical protein